MPDITELKDPEAEVQCLSGDDGPSADYPTRPGYWKSPRMLRAGSVVPRPRGHLNAHFLGPRGKDQSWLISDTLALHRVKHWADVGDGQEDGWISSASDTAGFVVFCWVSESWGPWNCPLPHIPTGVLGAASTYLSAPTPSCRLEHAAFSSHPER